MMKIEWSKIEADYLPNDTGKDDDRMRTIKEAIAKLTPAQRKIWITYVDNGTYTSVANAYNVSVPTAKKYITEVKQIILDLI